MSVAAAVSDASPLIVFHQIERLNLVRAVLGTVLIPPAVAREIAPSLGDPPDWMPISHMPTVRGSDAWWSGLDRGEIETIALAIELSAGRILIDDRPARRVAKQLGLNVVGSIGGLLDGYRQGFVNDIRPILDAMIEVGFYVGPLLYEEALGLAEEVDRERGRGT